MMSLQRSSVTLLNSEWVFDCVCRYIHVFHKTRWSVMELWLKSMHLIWIYYLQSELFSVRFSVGVSYRVCTLKYPSGSTCILISFCVFVFCWAQRVRLIRARPRGSHCSYTKLLTSLVVYVVQPRSVSANTHHPLTHSSPSSPLFSTPNKTQTNSKEPWLLAEAKQREVERLSVHWWIYDFRDTSTLIQICVY